MNGTGNGRGCGAGRIGATGRLFNAALAAGLVLALVPPACKKTVEQADAGPSDAGAKPASPPSLPTTTVDALTRSLPLLPELGVQLGDPSATLRSARPRATAEPLTPAVWIEELPAGGAHRFATYVFTRDGTDRLETLILSLPAAFNDPTRFQQLADSAARRVGPGEPFTRGAYQGLQWAVPGYRIELRRDPSHPEEDAELVFDARGGRQIELP